MMISLIITCGDSKPEFKGSDGAVTNGNATFKLPSGMSIYSHRNDLFKPKKLKDKNTQAAQSMSNIKLALHDKNIWQNLQVDDLSIVIDTIEASHSINGWQTIKSTPTTINLKTIQKKSIDLADVNVPIGIYDQIRLMVSTQPTVTVGGVQYNITIPSVYQTGIKLPGPFDIKLGKQVQIFLNFDIEKSVNYTKGQGWKMSPVLHVDRIDEYDVDYIRAIPDQALVMFDPSVSEDAAIALVESYGFTALQRVLNTYLISTANSTNAIDLLYSDSKVMVAEPNYALRGSSIAVNDKFYTEAQSYLSDIYIQPAWSIIAQNNIKVAVLDTGVYCNHEDLTGRVIEGYNFVTIGELCHDVNGHGTAVAGIIAANRNTVGIAGVNDRVDILPVTLLDMNGVGSYYTLVQGIIYAADQGAKIINVSLGGYVFSEILQSAVQYAQSQGAIIVAAAGNDGTIFSTYPSALFDVISVGGSYGSDIWSSSNWGTTVDILAPADNIFTLTPWNNSDGFNYGAQSGTSFAAPMVSGVISILLGIDPNLTATNIETLLKQTGNFVRNRTGNYNNIPALNAGKLLSTVSGSGGFSEMAIIDISSLNMAAVQGRNNPVTITVQNQGTSNNSATVEIKVDNSVVSTVQTGQIAAGGLYTTSININPNYAVAQKHEVSAGLTVSNDTKPGNNRSAEYIYVWQADRNDLKVERVTLVPVWGDLDNNSQNGELIFNAMAVIKNQGTQIAMNVPVEFSYFYNGNLLSANSDTINTILSGNVSVAYTKIIFNDWPSEGFPVSVIAHINYADDVNYNNTGVLSTQIKVSENLGVEAFHHAPGHNHIGIQAAKVLWEAIGPNELTANIINSDGSFIKDIGDVAISINNSRLLYGLCDEDAHDVVYHYGDSIIIPEHSRNICATKDLNVVPAMAAGTHYWDADFGDTHIVNLGSEVSILYGFLSSLYQTPASTSYLMPNTLQKSVLLWNNAIKTYKQGNKELAYEYLGRVLHLVLDMSVPSHVHQDPHPGWPDGWNDDSFEDWASTSNGKFYYNSSTAKNLHPSNPPFNGLIGVPFYQLPTNADIWKSAEYTQYTFAYVTPLAWQICSTIPCSNFDSSANFKPLYYLMHYMNERTDYFASDDVDGNAIHSQTIDQTLFGSNMYNGIIGPTSKLDLSRGREFYYDDVHRDNDKLCAGWHCYDDDNNKDNDLNKIGFVTVNSAILASATLMAHFLEQVGQYPPGMPMPPVYLDSSTNPGVPLVNGSATCNSVCETKKTPNCWNDFCVSTYDFKKLKWVDVCWTGCDTWCAEVTNTCTYQDCGCVH